MPDVKKITVLYVEDNSANLRIVEAMLRQQPDMALLAATNAEYGMALASQHQPDMILLDIHLPSIDGYEMLQRLKDDPNTSKIPVVALSADAQPNDVKRGLAAGFKTYLTKPIRSAELVETIRSLVRQPSQ